MSDDILNLLESYWRSKCVASSLPTRRDIDPAEIRRLLAHIALIDVDPDSGAFSYRLVGTRVVQQLAYDPTGEDLQDCAGTEQGSPFWVFLSAIAANLAPRAAEVPYFGNNASFGTVRLNGFPLVIGGRIDKILLGFSFAGATMMKEAASR
ncbi:MAG: PAS domain-containing protein [Minwuia sp.]|nr:PAS domain-containing protein [Minwuia sp.]